MAPSSNNNIPAARRPHVKTVDDSESIESRLEAELLQIRDLDNGADALRRQIGDSDDTRALDDADEKFGARKVERGDVYERILKALQVRGGGANIADYRRRSAASSSYSKRELQPPF